MRRAHWPSATPAQTHDALEADILRYLGLHGWLAYPTHGPRNRPIVPGWPDVQAFRDGRALFVEVKVGKDKASVDQMCVALSLREHGCRVVEARRLEDVMREVGK